jgi:hypothetical protein
VVRLLCAAFLMSRVVSAAVDACAMIPSGQISGMLGTTKNNGITNLKQLPPAPNATEGKACSYIGKDNSATVVWYKFPTPAAAREYLRTKHDEFEKQNVKMTAEKLEGSDGYSFSSGMLAVKRNIWLRVNVYSTGGKVVVLDLTRQLMLDALRAN